MYMKLAIINYSVFHSAWRIATVVFSCMYTWNTSYVLSVKVTLYL